MCNLPNPTGEWGCLNTQTHTRKHIPHTQAQTRIRSTLLTSSCWSSLLPALDALLFSLAACLLFRRCSLSLSFRLSAWLRSLLFGRSSVHGLCVCVSSCLSLTLTQTHSHSFFPSVCMASIALVWSSCFDRFGVCACWLFVCASVIVLLCVCVCVRACVRACVSWPP